MAAVLFYALNYDYCHYYTLSQGAIFLADCMIFLAAEKFLPMSLRYMSFRMYPWREAAGGLLPVPCHPPYLHEKFQQGSKYQNTDRQSFDAQIDASLHTFYKFTWTKVTMNARNWDY